MKIVVLLLFCISPSISSFGQTSDRDKGLIAFDAKKFKEAIIKLKPYADKGDCLAQFCLGFSYMYDGKNKNDSLARQWLLLAAEQKQANAMGPLAVNYFMSGIKDANIEAYLWAVLAAEYSPPQRFTTATVLIKGYLTSAELIEANKRIEIYKEKWKDKPLCD